MARTRFSWDNFKNLNYDEKVCVLYTYPLNTNGIATNLFLLIKFYTLFFKTNKLKDIFNSVSGNKNASLFELNFKKVISYCIVYNFYKMR